MEYQTSSVSLSQKLSTGHSIYDGVFSSAPSKFMVSAFSSRLEDYNEIFGGSSSIPVLEVPELSERKASVDVRSSKLDYSNVFGGFGDSDFAVPYEELFAEPNKKNKLHKESRTQTSKEANPSCPEENLDLSKEAAYQSFDEVKKFRMSYNKSNHRSKSFGSGTTGIAELHAVPAYTCLIDETTPLSTTEGDKPVSSVIEDNRSVKARRAGDVAGGVKVQNSSNWKNSIDELFNSNNTGQVTHPSSMPPFPSQLSEGDKPLPSEANNASTVNGVERIMEGSHHMKATKDHQSTDANKLTSGGVAKARNSSNWKRSGSIDSLFSSGEIGQGTSPSKLPPFPGMSSQGKGKYGKPMASVLGVSNSDIFEGGDSVSSPPYFDEEVDTNSVAAASVAALTKAIEEAQASIQMAKELMDRKKVGLQSRVKLSFDSSTKLESRKGDKFADKASVSKKKTTKELYDRVDVPVRVSAGPEQVTPAFEDASIISGVKVTGREMHGKEFAGDASIFKEKKSREIHEEVDVTVHVSAGPEQVTATVEDADKLGDWKEIQGKGHGKECELTPSDHRHQEADDSEAAEQFYEFADTGEHDVLEAAEQFYEFADSSEPDVSEAAEEFYEFADSNEHSDTTLENEEADNTRQMFRFVDGDKKEKKKTAMEAFETPEQGSKSIKVVTEEENREVEKIFNVVGGISEFEDDANELASAQEVYHQEDNGKSQDAPREHEDTWKLKATHVKETFEEKQNGDDKRFENQELQETEHVKIKLVAQERVENEKIDREACMQEENEREQQDAHMAEDTERSLNKDSRQEIIETVNDFNDEDDFAKRLEDDSESEGNEKLQDTRANEKLQKDAHMAEDTERSLNKDSRQEIIETVNDLNDEDDFEKRLKDDGKSEGNEKLQDTRANEKLQKDAHMAEDTERSLNKDSRQEIIETVNDLNDEDDFEKRLKDDGKSEGNEKLQDTRANEKLQKDAHMAEDTERSLNKDSRQEIIETVNDLNDEDDFEKRLKDDGKSEGNEKLQDTRANEKLQKDAHMAEVTERSLDKDSRQEIIETVNDLNDEDDFEKRLKDDGKSEGNEKLQDTRANEKLQKDAHMAEVTERSLNKDSRQEIIETVNDLNDEDDFEKTLKDDGESEGNEKLQDTRANEKILEGYTCQKKECENRERESFKLVEVGRMQILIDESTEDEKVKATQEDQLNLECNFEAADNQYEHEEASTRHIEYDNDVEETLKVPTHEEDGGIIGVAETLMELKENEHRSELPEEKNGMEEKEMCETDDSAPGVKLPEMPKQMEDATEIHSFDKNGINASRNDMSIGQKQDDRLAEEPNVDCNLGRQVEEFEKPGDINKDMMEAEVAVNQERNNNSSKPRKRWFGTNEVSETLIKLEEDGNQSESAEEEDVMEEKVICEIEGLAAGVKLADILVEMEDVIETHPSDTNGTSVYRNAMNCGKSRDAQLAREPEVSCNLGKHVEEHGEINDMMEAEVAAVSHEENMHNTKSSHRKRWFDNGNDTKVAQAPLIFGTKGGSVLLDHEMETSVCRKRNKENRHKVMASQSTEGNEENQQSSLRPKESETIYRSPKELEQENNENPQATLSSEESETDHSSQEDGKEGIKVSQATLKTEESETNYTSQKEVEREKKENQQETPTAKQFEISDSSQKEMELQKEHMIQKAAKRMERERLKDKKAAERAMREARERSFVEARERAAETRQKVMAEAQGRLGKTSVQANDTSLAEKASKEAKLKLERAAVERATVEARERALEKALSEKAAYEAGKQAKRSVSEKYSGASTDGKAKRSVSEKVSGSSRDNGTKLSFDPESKSSFPSSSSRSPNSSNQCDPSSAESSGGTNGESAQRSKARLERNQRTAERAAKALAEKNNRDLLVQQEQAERNRLAEVLDAEVKRWSSGKERNLRALLSTLQYILGPDSGWQPVPLTDIVTAVAVKKAYRKAALFVHPDKLQQRGASIQQKYTCEKVFDLLKEAWNRFSVEER